MRREIKIINPRCSGCCPGHDKYPNDTYRNRRSKKKRALGKCLEHRAVRRIYKMRIKNEVE